MRGEGRKSSKREQRMPRWRRHSARTLAPGSNLERQATNTRPFTLNYDCDLSRSIIDPSRQLSLSGFADQHKESTTQHFISCNVANHRVFKSAVAANFDLREKMCFSRLMSVNDWHSWTQPNRTNNSPLFCHLQIDLRCAFVSPHYKDKNKTKQHSLLCHVMHQTTDDRGRRLRPPRSSSTEFPPNRKPFCIPAM